MRVEHTIEPVFDANSRVLVLGTMPSPKSREVGFYYMHPRNRFWPVISRLLSVPTPEGVDARRQLALDSGIALWDVLASCEIEGASDASIKDAVPNDIKRVLDFAPISAVFTTGTTATRLFRRFQSPLLDINLIPLPSTSPANAQKSLDDLVQAYSVILDHLL